MGYHLGDYYDLDLEEPTGTLDEIMREAIEIYQSNTDVPLRGIYLVGGLANYNTSTTGRKDVDFLFVPQQRLRGQEKDRLYFLLTNHLQDTFAENYEVFVNTLHSSSKALNLTDHYL